MKTKQMFGVIVVVLIFTLMGATVGFTATNVALNKTVTLNGVFFTDGWGSGLTVPAGTVVDGTFFARQHQWDQGPVWWDSSDANTGQSIIIDLEGTYLITSLIVQADDNDAYKVYYWDFESMDWVLAWDVPNYDEVPDASTWGMQTRPNQFDDTEPYVLPSPIVTNALKIEGNMSDTGDYLFSISEVQAFGIVEFTKEIVSTTEGGDMDGVLETGEKWAWELDVLLTNISGETIEVHNMHDRIGGDLEADWTWYDAVLGPIDMYTRGKTEKVFFDFDFIGGPVNLADDATIGFGIWVSPDMNPSNSKKFPGGHQEFTSSGLHCLNSGAWFEGYIGSQYIEATSNPVCVEVFDAD